MKSKFRWPVFFGQHCVVISVRYSMNIEIRGFPDINWELLSGISSSLKFRDAISDCCFVQLVHTPTRGHSILDLVLTNDPSIFSEVNVIEPLLGSDHRAVTCHLSFSVSCPSPQIDRSRSFDYRLANWDLYADIVQKVNWDDMFSLLRL